MKKTVLFITLIIASVSQAQIVNIPDPIFKNRLLNHTNPIIDTNSDGEIQVSEAEAITGRINVSTANYSDMTGIEAFTNMTELLCAETQVTDLDLSSNVNLTFLDCNDSQINNLNISNCTNLIELFCFGNQLTTLNVNNNIHLNLIFCYDNQITELNLMNNSELEILSAFNNQISSIDLSNNSNLIAVALSQNLFTTIDISNNSNVFLLWCQDNPNLVSVNLKNGNNSNFNFSGNNVSHFENTPNLTSICIDNFNDTVLKNNILNQVGHSINFTDDCSTLSLSNFFAFNFSVYPTPTENILNIKSKTEIIKIEVYNKLGQLIIKTTENNVDVSNLTKDLYFVRVEDINGNFDVKKFIKK